MYKEEKANQTERKGKIIHPNEYKGNGPEESYTSLRLKISNHLICDNTDDFI